MKTKAFLSTIGAGILWGIISLFLKPLGDLGLDPIQIPFMRMLVAAICFTTYLLITEPKKLKIHLKDCWIFIGTGIISEALFNYCYFYGVIHGQASIAVVLMYTSTIFIMLLSALLFKEKITPIKLLSLFITICGCVFVSGVIGANYHLSFIIILMGIASGFFYATYTIFSRYGLERGYDPTTIVAYTFIFGVFGSIPLGQVPKTFTLICEKPIILLWCLGIGIICSVFPYFMYTFGLKYLEASKAAIFVAIEPLVGAIIGMTVFQESHSLIKIIGIVCILTAIMILSVFTNEKKKGEES